MAALTRPTQATYTINENVTVDTTDREDHTFCGIMFPLKCKEVLPVDRIVINSISVRGRLGPLTVWVTKDNDEKSEALSASSTIATETLSGNSGSKKQRVGNRYNLRSSTITPKKKFISHSEIKMKKIYWSEIYNKTHSPSFHTYCELDLSQNPIVIKPGQVRGVYIHSTLPGDEAIVYDNKQKNKTHDDSFLTVLPGRSHVSTKAFGVRPIWGWGNAWRDNREFVGRISYGVVYKLWNPTEHLNFGRNFQGVAEILFACQRRLDSPMSMLPDECIFYILNMCRWDWMKDNFNDVRIIKKEKKKTTAQSLVQGVDNSVINAKEDCSCEAMEDASESLSDGSDLEGSHDESDSDDGYEDHRASSTFSFNNYDDFAGSSDEDDDSNGVEISNRRTWMRNRLARIHILRVINMIEGGNHDDAQLENDENVSR